MEEALKCFVVKWSKGQPINIAYLPSVEKVFVFVCRPGVRILLLITLRSEMVPDTPEKVPEMMNTPPIKSDRIRC